MNDPLASVRLLLGRARARLRRRAATRGLEIGVWVGLGLALVGPALRLGIGLPTPIAAGISVAALLLASATGALALLLRKPLDDRDTAFLLDRALGTNEVLVTALGLADRDDARSADVLAAAGRLAASEPPLDRALPVRMPRTLRWAPVALLALVGLFFVPRRPPAVAVVDPSDPASVLAAEGETLEERIAEIRKDTPEIALPEQVDALEELAEQMQEGAITPEAAAERLKEIQESLAASDKERAEAEDLLEDLEKAAEALKESPATQDLAEALEEGDMEQAATEASKLAEQLQSADPAERAAAAEALQQAGEQLAQSTDPRLQEAGEAMKQAADGAKGSPDGKQGLTPEQAGELAKQLQQARDVGEKLEQSREQIQASQRLNGAAERTASALEKPPAGDGQGQPKPGEGDGDGDGEGEGDGDGEGEGEGRPGERPANAGKGHTWEDEGESDALSEHQDADRNSDRTGGKTADDFQKIYAPVRPYQGQGGQIASAPGQLDESGHVDQLTVRLTGSDEQATAPRLDLPAGYRDAATRALTEEEIPPGYRDSVKEYFDGFGG